MDIVIDVENPVPLFAQLIEQIKSAVINERIAPGDALPSIRQLANDLQLNSKTVAKAYSLLERDSVIQSRGYRGSFVHADAKKNCHVDLKQWATDKLNEWIKTLKSAGVTDSEIRIAFNDAMSQNN